MNQRVTIVAKISPLAYRVKDGAGRERVINSDKSFSKGDEVLLVSGVAIGKVDKQKDMVYNV